MWGDAFRLLPMILGTRCEINVRECVSSPCQNGGTCVDMINQYRCACRGGYTGRHCGIEIDECASDPCKGSANCVERVRPM